MADHSVWIIQPSGQRIKLAECDTRPYAELIMDALRAYKPAPVQEEANSGIMADTFKLDNVELVWKSEK